MYMEEAVDEEEVDDGTDPHEMGVVDDEDNAHVEALEEEVDDTPQVQLLERIPILQPVAVAEEEVNYQPQVLLERIPIQLQPVAVAEEEEVKQIVVVPDVLLPGLVRGNGRS